MSNLTIALEGKELEEYIAKRFGKKEHKEYMNEQRLNREKQMQTTTLGIVDTLTRFRFVDEFQKIRPNNFSYEGLHALYDYFDDLSHDIGNRSNLILFRYVATSENTNRLNNFKKTMTTL